MSNALLKSVELQKEKEAQYKEVQLDNLRRNMETLKENLLKVFSKKIFDSFDIVEIHPVETQYYSFKAILIYDAIPIELHLYKVSLTTFGAIQATLRVGTETLKNFQVTLPNKRTIDNTISDNFQVHGLVVEENDVLEKIQDDNDNKLIRNLTDAITKRVDELKLSKPKWWYDTIPKNYSGAYQVEGLLKNLEIDRVFLTDEQYTKILSILNGVLIDARIKDKDDEELKIKNTAIVKREREAYELAYKQYEIDLIKMCQDLAKEYFKPWTLYTAVYFPENFDPRDLRDEDGETNSDLVEAVTAQSSYVGEPDSEGYFTCVHHYGVLSKRKISNNLYHTDKTEFNVPNTITQTTVPFWKRIVPDTKCNGIGYLVPPNTVMRTDHVYPVRPTPWDEVCKKLGVKEPWNWK